MNRPLVDIEPFPVFFQVTDVSVDPATVAVNCIVANETRLAVVGVIEIVTVDPAGEAPLRRGGAAAVASCKKQAQLKAVAIMKIK